MIYEVSVPADMMARIAGFRKLQQQAKKRSALKGDGASAQSQQPQEPNKQPAKRARNKRSESGNAEATTQEAADSARTHGDCGSFE